VTTSPHVVSDGDRIYLDANALIALVEGRNSALATLVSSARAGRVRVISSMLTLAEVLVGPLRSGDDGLAASYERFFGEASFLMAEPVTTEILLRAARIRAATSNRLADAIHVATAESAGCAHFLSADRRLRVFPPMVLVDFDDIGTP
jgi:predicted nucleic acid-binding protein